MNEIENQDRPLLKKTSNELSSFLRKAEKISPHYWGKPKHIFFYLKTNIKYLLNKIVR